MSNTIVHIIEGNPNSGKTLTAWLVYLELAKNGIVEYFHIFKNGNYAAPDKSDDILYDIATYSDEQNNMYSYDFCSIVKVNNTRVAIFSAGDSAAIIGLAFGWMSSVKPDVFVGCSRSHGNSEARQLVRRFEDEYRIIYHRVYRDYMLADINKARAERLPIAFEIVDSILPPRTQEMASDNGLLLESVHLDNLWKKYHIQWPLNRHVNILTGDNGAGKSTVLYTLYTLLKNKEQDIDMLEKSDGIEVKFTDGSQIKSFFLGDKYSNIREQAERAKESNSLYSKVLDELVRKVEEKYSLGEVKDITVQASVDLAILPDKKQITPQQLLSRVRVDLIRTFDVYTREQENRRDGKNEPQNRAVSELDRLLRSALEQYAYYIGKLGDRAMRIMSGAEEKEEVYNLMQDKDRFLSILDTYFKDSGKSVVAEQGKLQFRLADSQQLIDVYALSSGEKQLVYTLLTVLLEERLKYVLLMDEPEISLHVGWQRKLIGSIKTLNPNCQIILATHSPAIFAEGYHSVVTNIEDIRTISTNE